MAAKIMEEPKNIIKKRHIDMHGNHYRCYLMTEKT